MLFVNNLRAVIERRLLAASRLPRQTAGDPEQTFDTPPVNDCFPA